VAFLGQPSNQRAKEFNLVFAINHFDDTCKNRPICTDLKQTAESLTFRCELAYDARYDTNGVINDSTFA